MIAIDIKMPDRCWQCPIFDFKERFCNALRRYNLNTGLQRMENCPLKEIDNAVIDQCKLRMECACFEYVQQKWGEIIPTCTDCNKECRCQCQDDPFDK